MPEAPIHHRVTLPSGVTLAVNEYGDPRGRPALFCHGWPSSRLQGAFFDAEARAMGWRILAPDRPGVGGSALQPGRTLTQWPALAAELMDHFSADRFAVLGVSGGGPYVLAAAHGLPERVTRAAVVCGAPPLDGPADRRALLPLYQWLLAANGALPLLTRQLLGWARPVLRIPLPHWSYPLVRACVPRYDRERLRDRAAVTMALECSREAWRCNGLGVALDAQIYAQPWGFPPEEIRVPVTVWHGREDTSFHWKLAEGLAERIPGAEFRLVPETGHYSLPFAHTRAILESLG